MLLSTGSSIRFQHSEDWTFQLSVSNQIAWHLYVTSDTRKWILPTNLDEVAFVAFRDDVIVTTDDAGADKGDNIGEENEEEGPGQRGLSRVDIVQFDLMDPENAAADWA